MARVRTKLCGMMTPADARAAADAGADAIGMILYANARRRIDLKTAAEILAQIPPYVTAVGVFVDAPIDLIVDTARTLGLSTLQLHGDESPADVLGCAPLRVIKAIKVDESIEATLQTWREAKCPNLIALLLETAVAGAAGGTGIRNDFEKIAALQQRDAFHGLPPVVVSGGLTPDNVADIVRRLRPYAVDVSSGIEIECGKKSSAKMNDFVQRALTGGV